MKNEDTIYDETIGNKKNTTTDAASSESSGAAAGNGKKGSLWRKAAVGMGAGIILGSTTSFVMTKAAAADGTVEGQEAGDDAQMSAESWTDGNVPVAEGVSDEMTFGEAFAAARDEVGSGGAFEWHGNVYSTYTAEEWDGMSEEERDEYYDHFNWSAQASDDSEGTRDSSEETGLAGEDTPVSGAETAAEAAAETGTEAGITADEVSVEEVPVNEVPVEDAAIDGTPAVEASVEASVEETPVVEHLVAESSVEVDVVESNPEVEVLGVMHDEETGSNVAGMMVDDQEVVLIDVDGNDTADYMAVDLNGDGQITDDEIADISDEHIEISQFENDLYMDNSLYASSDGTTDYINDLPDGSEMA